MKEILKDKWFWIFLVAGIMLTALFTYIAITNAQIQLNYCIENNVSCLTSLLS